jgi:hypothetical protein
MPGLGPTNAFQGIVHARSLCWGESWALLSDACQGNVHARSPCYGGSWVCLAAAASERCMLALDTVSLGLCPTTPAKAMCMHARNPCYRGSWALPSDACKCNVQAHNT